jgi:hypothetical protein
MQDTKFAITWADFTKNLTKKHMKLIEKNFSHDSGLIPKSTSYIKEEFQSNC